MRKNGVNRELTPVSGGVCAPAGFRANGAYCGIAENANIASRETKSVFREDITLVAADRRCACACTYAQGGILGAPARLTQKRLAAGYARAVFVNSGVANVYMEGGEKLAKGVCSLLADELQIREEEIAIASTGRIGTLSLQPIAAKMGELVAGLGDTDGHSLAAARGLTTTDKTVKQLAYSFALGDYTCKIGAIFKGGSRVCPNMATTLCILTTDVAISSERLQKAFSAAVGATLGLLNVDGVSSPNDFACILANGRAGNYTISENDGEYKKFCRALNETLLQICKRLAGDGGKAAQCRVTGARSAKAAREAARAVASAGAIRSALREGRLEAESVLCALHTAGEPFVFERVRISLGKLALLEQGRVQALPQSAIERALEAEDVVLAIGLGNGNYGAVSTFTL